MDPVKWEIGLKFQVFHLCIEELLHIEVLDKVKDDIISSVYIYLILMNLIVLDTFPSGYIPFKGHFSLVLTDSSGFMEPISIETVTFSGKI